MAQHDYVIDNQSFPATRTDLNNVLQAIVSNNSGTSAPSTTFAGQIWLDTSTSTLFIRNNDNDANIALFQLDQSADVAATVATIIDVLDASGTDTAGTALTIRGGAGTGSGAGGSIILQVADGGSSGSSVNSHATAVTIEDDGDVGIGVSSPTFTFGSGLEITRPSGTPATMRVEQALGTPVAGEISAYSSSLGMLVYTTSAHPISFGTSGGTKMTLDTSGRLLVGKTTNAIGTAGCNVQGDGFFSATRDDSHCAGFNRLSSTGDVVKFFKDGSEKGSVGISAGGFIFIGNGDVTLLLAASTDQILPRGTAGAARSGVIDLGSSANRFDDIFASSALNTSDQNEKESIAPLTSAEITAAKAISKLFKTFKWKNMVASKGDAARTHTGVIAQEVEKALTDAGLDASKYAFWCSDTWYETETEVPAVEADEENGIEAKDAYTRTDTYNTKDEAPEGATEITRLSIRYSELMAFVGAATEQRLADIETRLAALEG